MRYWTECETCTEDMQRAYCSYCEKPLVEVTGEVSQREKQHEAMRGLLEELASNQWDAKTRDGYPETSRAASDLDRLRHKAKALLESMKG